MVVGLSKLKHLSMTALESEMSRALQLEFQVNESILVLEAEGIRVLIAQPPYEPPPDSFWVSPAGPGKR